MEREVLTLQPARQMNRQEGRGEAASREEGPGPQSEALEAASRTHLQRQEPHSR